MTFSVRDGKFDVVVVAGPRIDLWPSAGVRVISSLCAEMGLKVGVFGGPGLNVRGVIPLPGTGGIVVIEDIQHRIHRIHARAVVRVSSMLSFPDPFPGWRSEGLIPFATAMRLRRESLVQWDPCTVILGTGNRALRFGSSLLESGVEEIYCVESFGEWGAKRFSGWEVERRRFEMAGGKLIEAKPIRLVAKAPLIWELKLQDHKGVRVLEVARVVAAGPFADLPGVREHPPGSFLFELEQTSSSTRADDVQGWVMEEERARWLAGKMIKALISDLGENKETVDSIHRRAKVKTKRNVRHREEPFLPAYQGKWIASEDARKIRSFSGVPQHSHRTRFVASIECFEEISCNLCKEACPEGAIEIGKIPRGQEKVLTESKCTSCNKCLIACPSGAPVMIHEQEERSVSRLTLAWRGAKKWTQGEFATLINRRGETLGSGRVIAIEPMEESQQVQLVQVEVPTHLVWEARSLRRVREHETVDKTFIAASENTPTVRKVEITFNGEKRLVRDGAPITMALFETGRSRSEDVLFCPDGTCGLCQVLVDGVEKQACQTMIHRGMAIRLMESPAPTQGENAICPCLGVTRDQVIERMLQGTLKSPEAVLSVTHVGEGKCHGQLCLDALRRVVLSQGLDADQWVDWRFPWSEWELNPTSN